MSAKFWGSCLFTDVPCWNSTNGLFLWMSPIGNFHGPKPIDCWNIPCLESFYFSSLGIIPCHAKWCTGLKSIQFQHGKTDEKMRKKCWLFCFLQWYPDPDSLGLFIRTGIACYTKSTLWEKFINSTGNTFEILFMWWATGLCTEKKKRAKILESNFENRLSFVGESHFFLHNHVYKNRELSYGQPFWLSFFSQCESKGLKNFSRTFGNMLIKPSGLPTTLCISPWLHICASWILNVCVLGYV